MDWTKAKNVLIILFVALNVYLGINIVKYYKNDNVSSKTITQVKGILSNNGIDINCEIPNITKCYRLNYKNTEFNKMKVVEKLLGYTGIKVDKIQVGKPIVNGSKTLEFDNDNVINFRNTNPNESVDISSNEAVIKYCSNFMSSIGVAFSEYYIESYQENKNSSITIKFTEKYKGYLVFDNSAEILISKRGIESLKCVLVGIIGLSKYPIEIVPVYKILLKNFTNGKNATIDRIDIGFKCTYPSEGTNYDAVPEWRIKFNNSEILYFTAVG